MTIESETQEHSFTGCKLALIVGSQLVVYLRDNSDSIPFPNHWDFPGGGREGKETAEECVLRELNEEFSIVLTPECLIYKQSDVNQTNDGYSYFFVAYISHEQLVNVRFGDEGQYWQLMEINDYLIHPQGVKPLQQRLSTYLTAFSCK